MWWMPLVMAGIGALQAKQDRDAQEKAQNKRQAQQNRINAYAPLLGVAPQVLDPTPPLPSVSGAALGGAFSGFNQMQAYDQSELQNEYLKARTEEMRRRNVVNNYQDDDMDFLNGL